MSVHNQATKKAPFFATNGHLMLCQGPSCQQHGSVRLYTALEQSLEQHKLLYYKQGGSLRFTRSGCLGACSFGPILACYRRNSTGVLQEGWYQHVHYQLALDVAQAVHLKQALPSVQRFNPSEEP